MLNAIWARSLNNRFLLINFCVSIIQIPWMLDSFVRYSGRNLYTRHISLLFRSHLNTGHIWKMEQSPEFFISFSCEKILNVLHILPTLNQRPHHSNRDQSNAEFCILFQMLQRTFTSILERAGRNTQHDKHARAGHNLQHWRYNTLWILHTIYRMSTR